MAAEPATALVLKTALPHTEWPSLPRCVLSLVRKAALPHTECIPSLTELSHRCSSRRGRQHGPAADVWQSLPEQRRPQGQCQGGQVQAGVAGEDQHLQSSKPFCNLGMSADKVFGCMGRS